MSENGNGHTNGHHNFMPDRWQSGAIRRGEVQDLCRAVIRGWLKESATPVEDMQAAIAALKSVMADPKTRPGTRAIAAKALTEALQQSVNLGLKIAEMDDRASRLDNDEPTDIVHYKVRMPEARARLGEPLED